LGLSAAKVPVLIKVCQNCRFPWNYPWEEADSHLGDFIEDHNAIQPLDSASKQLLKDQINEVLINFNHSGAEEY